LTNEPRYKSLCGAEAEAGRITCEATLRRIGLGHLRQRCAYTRYSRREKVPSRSILGGKRSC